MTVLTRSAYVTRRLRGCERAVWRQAGRTAPAAAALPPSQPVLPYGVVDDVRGQSDRAAGARPGAAASHGEPRCPRKESDSRPEVPARRVRLSERILPPGVFRVP